MLADFNLQFNMRKRVVQKRGCYMLVPFPMYLDPTVGTRGGGEEGGGGAQAPQHGDMFCKVHFGFPITQPSQREGWDVKTWSVFLKFLENCQAYPDQMC